ncbi:MAG: MATE family efflux transporter [Bacteroidales bacterium]|nr:MATE family efflux transporter [Bacteroidales bacterium]
MPIILGSIAQNIISITDTAFLGHVGHIALGASAIGGVFYLAFIMLAFGFGTGAQIIIARRLGEGNNQKIGRVWEHAFYFLLMLAAIVFVIIKFYAPQILQRFMVSDDVLHATIEYLDIRAFGIFFAFVNMAFRAFFVGIGRTPIIAYTTVAMALINIFFDYVLIFGNLGFPEMGIRGAALASMFAEMATTGIVVLYTLIVIDYKKYSLFRFVKFRLKIFLRIFRIASPMMLTNFASIGTWFIFFIIIEHLGEMELAVSQIVRASYIVLLLPVWGYSSATNTMVSYYLGRKRPDMLWYSLKRILVLSVVSVALITVLFFSFSETILSLFSNDPLLISMAFPVMLVISGAAVVLGIAFMLFNAVSGTGRTEIALIIEVVTLVGYVWFAWMMAHRWSGEVAHVWTAEYLYALLIAGMSLIFLVSKRWEKAKV